VDQTAGQRWMRSSEAAARWAGVVITIVGTVVLIGWWADIAAFRAFAPNLAEMKPNTAAALVLCGLALAVGAGRTRTARLRLAAGVTVAFIGAATLTEYFADIPVGIDRCLIGRFYAGLDVRMTIGAASAFLCAGAALILTAAPPREPSNLRLAESTLAVATLLIGLLALLGYLYGVRSLYQTAIYTSMAIHTAVSLTVVGIALLLSRPRQGLARLVGRPDAAGELARRLLGFFFVLTPLLGWLRLQGQHAGWYDTPFGLALLVWFMISLGVVVVWWTSGALGRADAFRSALQEDLAASITREHATASQRGAILDALPQAIALLDARGIVVSVNRGWSDVATDGDGARRAVGAVFADWGGGVLGVEPDDWSSIAAGISSVLSGTRPDYLAEIAARPRSGETGDGPLTSPTERERWLAVRVTPMNGGGRSPGGAVVTVSDVTEGRRLEEQLVHAQRLEAVGRLAGGVAHDFNNLLTAVTGHRALAQAAIEAGQSAEANLQAIEQAARSGAELTQELLAFGRRQVLATRVVSVTELIGDVRRLIDRSLGESVQLRISIPHGIWPARVDPARIEQVLMNLVINARDAIAAGNQGTARGPAGLVVIDAVNAELDEAYAAQRPGVEAGPYVCISVSDNGVGMSKQVLGRIFEPFFTTKARGKGSGLGLATSFGIVKQHGGHIAVYSEEGRGTTFRVYLPAAEGARVEPTHPADPLKSERGNERILLVDDHHGARAAVAGMLRSLGYAVVEAADAAEAERVARAENDRIDLLLCDVVLPDAQGPELAERLREVCPRAAVLFISGYTADAVVHHGSLESSVHFLSKPFTLDDLAAKVRSVLLQPR